MTRRSWGVVLLAVVGCQPAQAPPAEETAPAVAEPAAGTPEWKVTNAMSAGPASIAANATIMDWPTAEGGALTQLRAGTNGWMCLPDNTQTPGNDPMCLDRVWQAWADAWMNRKPFTTKVVGISYMLQGGSGPPGDDPFKMAPGPGEVWVTEPPHVMWIAPNPAALEGLPMDASGGGPFVMWKGTPYVHVMIPVK